MFMYHSDILSCDTVHSSHLRVFPIFHFPISIFSFYLLICSSSPPSLLSYPLTWCFLAALFSGYPVRTVPRRCTFEVFVGGGELPVLLLRHLDLCPTLESFFIYYGFKSLIRYRCCKCILLL